MSTGNGRNVTAAPDAVDEFHVKFGIMMETGVELKGTTVNVKGRDTGGLPPAKRISKEPHCLTEEKVIESNREKTERGPRARRATMARTEWCIAGLAALSVK